MKKASLSITTLVIALIALVVLVLIVAMFAGKIDLFGKSATSCADKGGLCNDKAWEARGEVFPSNPDPETDKKLYNKCPPEHAVLLNTDCNIDGQKGNDLCCVPIV